MARKKISEYTAKSLLYKALHIPYEGIQITSEKSAYPQDKAKTYVVKVDEGIKRRFKKGLVKLSVPASSLSTVIEEFRQRGQAQFIIEPYVVHEAQDEKYLAIERIREGYTIWFANFGGVDIEDSKESVRKMIITTSAQCDEVADFLGMKRSILQTLLVAFDTHYFSFLEINPFLVNKETFIMLDVAVEVDSTATFFTANSWSEKDFVNGEKKAQSEAEETIMNLAAKSQAAFSLEVLNPDGSIFMLLSGGGASLVLADEIAHARFGNMLANYGEYSGNPNREETYLYTKAILSLLLNSSAKKKVLIIGGGVANFTDIRITFQGVIQALEEVKMQLHSQSVKIFVRRGGPYQKEALAMMRAFLEKENILGFVGGPECILTDVVSYAISYVADK